MADTVGFSVGAVARRLGVAPSTLRTWNRRYGIGAQELSPGRHRRYTPEDIVRLEHMQKLILRGAAPADAARAAMTTPVPLVPAPADGAATAVLEPGDAGAWREADGQDAALPPTGLSSCGQGRSWRRAAGGWPCLVRRAAARGLARAMLALDEQRISETIQTVLSRDGTVRTWEELLVPVLTGVGTRYEHAGTGVEAEHLLSVAIIAALTRRAADLSSQVRHRAVLLASAEGEPAQPATARARGRPGRAADRQPGPRP